MLWSELFLLLPSPPENTPRIAGHQVLSLEHPSWKDVFSPLSKQLLHFLSVSLCPPGPFPIQEVEGGKVAVEASRWKQHRQSVA